MSWSRFFTNRKDLSVFSIVVHDVHLTMCSSVIQFTVIYTMYGIPVHYPVSQIVYQHV